MNKERIMKRLQEHKEEVLKQLEIPESRFVGIFLYGSQNYGFANDDSDIDTKMVIIPSFKEIVDGRSPLSKEIVMENGEHCEVKDIRVMKTMFMKQNINFVETLFTEFYILNPEYESLYKKIQAKREEIAHYNPWKAMYSTLCQAGHRQKATPKRIHNTVRLIYFVDEYKAGKPYMQCIHPDGEIANQLHNIKYNYGEIFPEDYLELLYSFYLAKIETRKKELEELPKEEQLPKNEPVMTAVSIYIAQIMRQYLNQNVFYTMEVVK